MVLLLGCLNFSPYALIEKAVLILAANISAGTTGEIVQARLYRSHIQPKRLCLTSTFAVSKKSHAVPEDNVAAHNVGTKKHIDRQNSTCKLPSSLSSGSLSSPSPQRGELLCHPRNSSGLNEISGAFLAVALRSELYRTCKQRTD